MKRPFGWLNRLIYYSFLVFIIFNPLQTGCRYVKIGGRYINDTPYIIILPRNVTYLIEKAAYLYCQIQMLGNYTVSWTTDKYFDMLNVSGQTYTSGNWSREDDWSLKIKWAQNNSEGMHEFQITTQPKSSFFVNLNIVTSKATILGMPDLYVDKGSSINLTCTVHYLQQSSDIFWYHNEEVISYNSSGERISVKTENGNVTTSYLLIQHVDFADSGNYSCSSSITEVARAKVNVLNNDQIIAMQTGKTTSATPD